MTTVTITKIEGGGYAIANAYAHKDAIKAAVPSAKVVAQTAQISARWLIDAGGEEWGGSAGKYRIYFNDLEEFAGEINKEQKMEIAGESVFFENNEFHQRGEISKALFGKIVAAIKAKAIAVAENKATRAKKFKELSAATEPTDAEKAESLRQLGLATATGMRSARIRASRIQNAESLTEEEKIRQAQAFKNRIWGIINAQEEAEKLAEIVENLPEYEEKLAAMIADATRHSVENRKCSIEQAKDGIEKKLGATFEQIEKARAIAAKIAPTPTPTPTPAPVLQAQVEQNQNNKNDCENNQKNAAAIEKMQCCAVGRPKIYPDGVQPATAWRPKTPAIRAKYDALGGSRWLNERLGVLVQQDAATTAKK